MDDLIYAPITLKPFFQIQSINFCVSMTDTSKIKINNPAESSDQISICLAFLSHCAPSAHWWYIQVHAFTTRTPSLAQRP